MHTTRLRTFMASSLLALGLVSASANAQLSTSRLYFGVSKPVAIKVDVPADLKGEATICLYGFDAKEPTAKSGVTAGEQDLAKLFPALLTTPASQQKTVLAQLVVGEQPIGAPLVVQPLVNPPIAQSRGQSIQWMATGDKLSGFRIYTAKNVVMETTKGEIEFRLRPDHAPNTCYMFMDLVKGGYYTDVPFHRIVGSQGGKPGFMAQGGDPTGTGQGGPGFNQDLEQSRLAHDFGVLSMARTGIPDTAGSQFFVCFSKQGTYFLDGQYTAFAQAVRGSEAIVGLATVRVVQGGDGAMSRPVEPVSIVSSRLVDAPPAGTGPEPLKAPAEFPEQPTGEAAKEEKK